VGRLVQWLSVEPAPRVPQRRRVVAIRDQEFHEPLKDVGQLGVEAARLGHVPLLERRAVAEREPLEQAARTRLRRLRQRLGRVPLRREPAKALDVELEPVLSPKPDAVALGLDPFLADGAAQSRESAPEGSARTFGVLTRPQELAQRVARARALRQGQVSEQRGRLAGVERDGLAVAFDPRRAEQPDRHGHVRHDNSLRPGFVTIRGRRPGNLRKVASR
jgi:hypothetical protein